MKKFLSIFLIAILLIVNIKLPVLSLENKDYETEMKQDLLTLMLAYPGFITNIEKKGNDVFCVMKSGKRIIYDDKKNKSHEEILVNPDLQDMLKDPYPLTKNNEVMEKDFDPGRGRNYELLNEVYGSSRKGIESNLTSLKYGYPNYQFNKNNNANKALEAVLQELIPLSKSRSDIASILYPASGTFNYRVISGTGRLSPHAYGIAIDLHSDKRDYWKWSSKEAGSKRISEYPKELVETFEKHNFVWGGKWNHFDTLHFEYRPEIILKAKYFGDWTKDKKWFDGAPLNDDTSKYIEIIEKALDGTSDSLNAVSSNVLTDEWKQFVENIFLKKSKAVLSQDLDSIKSLYNTDIKLGQWAYEYEESKVKYINNWAQKQGVNFIEINPKIIIQKSNINDKSSSFYVMCNTEYKYVYPDKPDEVNCSRIGTYHSIQLSKQDDEWIISKEWYTDPFADSLKLEHIKADDIKQFISSKEKRDFSNLHPKRLEAVEYAKKYCGSATNPEDGFKYNKKYRNFNVEGGDCANFASQILHEGGGFKKNTVWNYDKGSATGPWINADKFTSYMIGSGRAYVIAKGSYEKVYKASYKLLPGDFVAYEKKGDITHISIVTGADSKGYPLVTCHNTDRNDVPWDLGWSNKNMTFWLVRVGYY